MKCFYNDCIVHFRSDHVVRIYDRHGEIIDEISLPG